MDAQTYLLFIESNTTGSGMQALLKAQELGLEPVLFTRNREQYQGLESVGCRVLSCETNELRLLRAAVTAFLASAPKKVSGITTTSEFYLGASSILAKEFGLFANTPEMIEKCRNKAYTRRILSNAGLPQPRFCLVDKLNDVMPAIEQLGLPCVVKPCDDTGSCGVKCCRTLDEARIHAAKLFSQSTNIRGQQAARAILYEEYIDAPEFSVETFAWQGEITCVGITEKRLTGFPYFVEAGHIFPALLSAESRNIIENTTKDALALLGNTYGPIHTEVKLTSQGCVIIEINARLAGGMIPELVWQAREIDLLKSQIWAACGQPPVLLPTRSDYSGIFFLTAPTAGRFLKINGFDAIRKQVNVVQAVITKSSGKKVTLPQSAYDRLGYVILRTDSYHKMIERLDKIQQEIEIIIEPDNKMASL